MAGGTYSLLLTLEEPTAIEVGALGERRFEPGGYAYTGSALGSGGFARIDRHRALAAGDRDTRHWHVDYLLGSASLQAVYRAPGEAIECSVARSLPGEPVPGFGASDCDCESHLAYSPEPAVLEAALEREYGPPVETA